MVILAGGQNKGKGGRHMGKERNRKSIGWYLLFAWILFLYMFACYYALDYKNQTLSANVDMTTPQDFRSRLKKHGLAKQFSIIKLTNGKHYFYRDGKKYEFNRDKQLVHI